MPATASSSSLCKAGQGLKYSDLNTCHHQLRAVQGLSTLLRLAARSQVLSIDGLAWSTKSLLQGSKKYLDFSDALLAVYFLSKVNV